MMPYKRRQQHLGEVDGLNTGGQLRRTRDGDDDEEALAAGVPTINAGEPPASSLALAVGAAAAAAAGGSRAAGMQEGDGSASSDSSAAASTQDNVAQEDEVAISGATLAPGGDPAPVAATGGGSAVKRWLCVWSGNNRPACARGQDCMGARRQSRRRRRASVPHDPTTQPGRGPAWPVWHCACATARGRKEVCSAGAQSGHNCN